MKNLIASLGLNSMLRTVLGASMAAALVVGCAGQPGENGFSAQGLALTSEDGGQAHDPAKFLARLDRDGNGKVEISELPERMRDRMASADTNKDGTLTPEEMKAAHEAHRAERFAKADADHDGAINESEAGPRWAFVSKLDADHDGKVTLAEMQAMPAMMGGRGHGRGHFGAMGEGFRGGMNHEGFMARMDANGDGKIEISELPERMKAHLSEADANHDGVLAQDELQAMREARKAAHEGKGEGECRHHRGAEKPAR